MDLLAEEVWKSRMKGDFHVWFCERLGLKCPCLLDVCPEALKAGSGTEPKKDFRANYIQDGGCLITD